MLAEQPRPDVCRLVDSQLRARRPIDPREGGFELCDSTDVDTRRCESWENALPKSF